MFADIIVDISHEKLDKTFQYRVPDSLADEILPGDVVCIPFGNGNRLIDGYVLGLSTTPKISEDKIKSIASVKVNADAATSRLIRIAYWMHSKYGSTMINALKTVLPVRRKIKEKEERTIVLKVSKVEANDAVAQFARKHRTARERLMRALLDDPQIDYRLVTGKLNISPSTISLMEEAGLIEVLSTRVYRNALPGDICKGETHALTPSQQAIYDEMWADYLKEEYKTYLLHGITGSGKTEIYMEMIASVVAKGRQAIVLIPEISLTYQTVMRFYKRFGDRVSTLHSKLSDGERYDQFVRAKNHEIDIIIGPRSALFTPFDNVGLIVIDEEHEPTYKSDSMPKYHARDVAIELANMHHASVILGSATPSLDSYYAALSGEYKLFTLDKRAVAASLPTVQIADLRQEYKDGNKSIFSRALHDAIQDRLSRHEQVMLFLNRRGYSGFVSCRSCGEVLKCPHCDVSLSEHRNGKLICHYCGYEQEIVRECPSCHSTAIGGMRAGTQQVEEMVKKEFPQASVLRMDADTTAQKDGYDAILSKFANREADILVGTQMIVKGHDFPYVTLVGILAADMSLNANDYRAGERTFQLLVQAAGRAGRADLKGEVIIQTYRPDHYSIVAAAAQNYREFYDEETAYRTLAMYPPCGHMLAVLLEHKDEIILTDTANRLAELLKNDIINCSGNARTVLIGPVDASIRKINDIYRKMIYVKSPDAQVLIHIEDVAQEHEEMMKQAGVSVSFDFDPMRGY